MGKRRSKLDPIVFDRERQTLELRTSGLTFDRIAERVGYSNASGARAAYSRALHRTLQPAAEEYRQLQGLRIEKAIESLWPSIEAGDPRAIGVFSKLLERQAKLFGLDAPTQTQVEVTTYDGAVLRERAAQIIEIIREHGNTSRRVGGEISSN